MIYRCLYKAKALVEMCFEGLLVVVTFPSFLALSYSSQVFGPLRLFFYSLSHSFILCLSFFSVLTVRLWGARMSCAVYRRRDTAAVPGKKSRRAKKWTFRRGGGEKRLSGADSLSAGMKRPRQKKLMEIE